MRYENRQEAGKSLAAALAKYRDDEPVILALPRGGVVLGLEVARALSAPLGVALVRKIGHPFDPEYAIGAIAENQKPIYNQAETSGLDEKWLEKSEREANELIAKRRALYFEDLKPPKLKGKTVIIVDDGIATGLTMKAGLLATRAQHPKKIILAVPACPRDSLEELQHLADDVIVLQNPDEFSGSVGAYYENFPQVEDDEVKNLLEEANS